MKKFDIFGRLILLRFQGKPVHKTSFGGIVTLTLIGIISARLAMMIKTVLDGNNPTLLFQERQSYSHQAFKISPTTFILAIGIQNSQLEYVQDEKYFTIQGQLQKKNLVYQESTQTFQPVYEYINFTLVKCTIDSIGIKETLDFYMKSQLLSHYCLPSNLDLEIEGEFNSDIYKAINISLKRCQGDNCYPSDAIDDLLNNHYVEVLFSDVFISPENKQNPFSKFARDLYWVSSQQLPKTVNLYLRNNYVESDVGLFTSDIKIDIYPSFSYSDTQLRFEKQKENYYKRYYQNAIQILSELGGFSQILMAISLFICSSYSNLHLNKALIDKTFNFQEICCPTQLNDQSCVQPFNDNSQTKNKIQTENNLQETEVVPNIFENIKRRQIKQSTFLQLENIKQKSFLQESKSPSKSQLEQIEIHFRDDPIHFDPKNLFSPSEKHGKSLPMTPQMHKKRISQLLCQAKMMNSNNQSLINMLNDQQSNSKREKTETKKVKQIESDFKKLIYKSTNSMKFNILKYFLSFFYCNKRLKQKKKVLDYSINKLYKHLDVSYIINKLIEVDKMKKIFLDDDQIQLLEYLPKPSINYQFTENDDVTFIDNKNEVFNINNRSDIDKMNGAISSFKNIMNKQKLTKIDNKIIMLIDSKFNYMFQEQLVNNQQIPSSQSPNFFPQQPIFNVSDDYIQEDGDNNESYSNKIGSATIGELVKSHTPLPIIRKNIISIENHS